MSAIDLALLRQSIGRTLHDEDIVTPRLVGEFRATLAPHLAAVNEGEAPLAIHWCLAPAAAPMLALGHDGHAAKGEFLPPVPLPRRMWAGGEVETLAPLRLGDRVQRTSTIEDVSLKEGRSGSLCFVAVRHELSTERGLAIRERHDIVYREMPAFAAVPPATPAPVAKSGSPPAEMVWTLETSPVLLFRYSAITFNGHRIHYDHRYVTEVEGYAGLVVHGPLQASLLFNLAAALGGRVGGIAPRRFSYRGVAPLIVGEPLRVCGRRTHDGEVTCWTETDGGIRMEGDRGVVKAPGVAAGGNPDEAATDTISAVTLDHYNQRADDFWEGTRGHDVSQNIDALLDHIGGNTPFTILDLGCGPGRDLKVFTDLGHRAVGLEGSARFAAMARAYSGCEVLEQDFLKLDLPAAHFDGVFANASLFHVPSRELPRVLRELHASLKPGGVLFASNPRGDNSEGWNRGRHGVYHDLESWRGYLSTAGFIELMHYYRPAGLPLDQQPWLASVWRTGVQ